MPFDPNQPFEQFDENQPFERMDGGFDPSKNFTPLDTDSPSDNQNGPSQLGVAARGAAQGLSFGFADEGMAAIQAPFSDKTYQELRDEKRAQLNVDKEAFPKTALASEIGGAVAPSIAAALTGAGAPASAGNAARLAQVGRAIFNPTTVKGMAAAGGAIGLGKSEADLTKGEIGEAGLDTGKGALFSAALGKALPPIAEYGGNVLKGAREMMGEGGEFLASKAVGLTKGLRKRFDLSPSEARGIGREALDSGVVTPFADAESMARAAAQVKKDVGDQIGEAIRIADESGIPPNFQKIINTLKEKQAQYAESRVARPIYNQYQKVISDIEGLKGNPMLDLPPGGVKGLQREKELLGKVAYPKGVSQESRIGYQEAYTPIKEALEESVSKTQSPQQTQIYKYLKDKYGKQKTIEAGLAERLSSEEGNRFIRPTDFLVGGAFGLGGGVLPGAAAVVAKRGIEKYGHQVGAVTLDRIGKILSRSSLALGPYSGIIRQAIQRGGTAFATTNFLLQQRDPQYRQMIEELSSKEEEAADGTESTPSY